VIFNPSKGFVRSVEHHYIVSDTDISSAASTDIVVFYNNIKLTANRQNSLDGRNEQNGLLNSKQYLKKFPYKLDNDYSSVNTCKNRYVNIRRHPIFTIYESSDSYACVQVFKEWPGRSPTVNISWFIAKAYLANLYYTTQRDVSLTIQTCDDIIDVYNQSEKNLIIAERMFPVILSTQWTSVYDKEIQELLGFYSLCSYVLDKCSSRSVYLGVCPVLFAHYVKLRTMIVEIRRKGQNVFNHYTSCRYITNFYEHTNACQCLNQVNIILVEILAVQQKKFNFSTPENNFNSISTLTLST